MRRFSLHILLLAVCALVPAGAALAQETGEGGTQPQVVEPKAGEAAPSTTTTPIGPTGPDAPVSSEPGPGAVTGPTGPTGPAGVTGETGTTGEVGVTIEGGAGNDDDNDQWLLIGAIVLGALMIAAIIIRVLWRWRGWDPRWYRRWRHANAEAAWRVSLSWAEFRDFLRLGR